MQSAILIIRANFFHYLPLWLLVLGFLAGCGSSSTTKSPKRKSEYQPTVSQEKEQSSRNALVSQAKIPSFENRPPEAPAVQDKDWFEDQAEQAGVNFSYRDGSEAGHYQLLESVGGGVASFDFDRDGWQDLFFTGGGRLSADTPIEISGRPAALFRNRPGMKFRDVSSQSGIDAATIYTHGCTAVDFDSDGFQDIVVAGYQGVQLWHNRGDGTFRDISQEMGLQHKGWNVAAAAGDYNADGLSDLYLLTYADWEPDHTRKCLNDRKLRDICGPTLFSGERDAFFENSGQRFEDVTDQVGLIDQNRGLGALSADLDQNDTIDFAVVNDVQANQLYLNDHSGSFRENAVLSGIAYSNTGEREGSMGISLGDFDGDSLPDLWYTNYTQQDNSLLRNLQDSGFVHSADVVGLGGVSRRWVGFGTGFADFNCDGWEDLYVINGHVAYERRDSPYFQPPQLFQNDQGKRFLEVTGQGGPYFAVRRSGRGSVTTDLDNDGDFDLVVTHQNDPVAVLKNRHSPVQWIRVELIGTTTERDAIGAVVSLERGGRTVSRWKIGGGSYLSHNDPRLLFSLTKGQSIDVVVEWLGGRTEVFSNLEPNRTHQLIEGQGKHGAK